MKRENLAGQKFGLLTVIELSDKRRNNKEPFQWLCVCDCGNLTYAETGALKCGSRKSCGCLLIAYQNRLSEEEAVINKLYSEYKKGAKDRGIQFALSKNSFIILVKSNCHYCGSPPFLRKTRKSRKTNKSAYLNGIDRKNNKLGYVEDNCVPACSFCNYAKKDSDYDDFIQWIQRIKELQ